MKTQENSIWIQQKKELNFNDLSKDLNRNFQAGYRLVTSLDMGKEIWFIFETIKHEN